MAPLPTLSDPAIKRQYQDALDRHLGPDVTLAGLLADLQPDQGRYRTSVPPGVDTVLIPLLRPARAWPWSVSLARPRPWCDRIARVDFPSSHS